MPLKFSGCHSVGKTLPENFLPGAFPVLSGEVTDGFYPLIPASLEADADCEAEGASSRQILSLPAADLVDFAKVDALIAGAGGTGCFIGPRMETGDVPSVDHTLEPGQSSEEVADVVAVLDAGIAFWNDRFCDRSRSGPIPRFEDVGYLQFAGASTPVPAVSFLGQSKLARLVALSRQPGREADVIDYLGSTYPESVFGRSDEAGQLYDTFGMNHGTAMADFAAGRAPEEQGTCAAAPVLFGIEMPREVILDASGDTLQAVISIVFRAALARIFKWWRDGNAKPRITIVLPFAFLGGPMDSSHPVIASIRRAIDHYGQWVDIKVCLPMGNHLQDQLHARLPNLDAGGKSPALRWFLQPDDYSLNTVEFVYAGVPDLTLHLEAPDGDRASVRLIDGQVELIRKDGQIIGAAWCRGISGNRTRLRVTLGPTAATQADGLRLSVGDWLICLEASGGRMRDVDAWVLRQDGTRYQRRTYPARQSYFRDDAYRVYDLDGSYSQSDSASCVIKRQGSASVLASGTGPGIENVAAGQSFGIGPMENAWYSGLLADPAHPVRRVHVDVGRKNKGKHAVGNGGPRLFRISGTSVAAALAARQ